ncbi:MAG: RDD family protein [Planctomycetales bacterium]|nr:RDD family protein [bacterium]UNM09059.1 MAG: RDD family protein [Planctomycetales bacterium]
MIDNQPPAGSNPDEDNQLWRLLQGGQSGAGDKPTTGREGSSGSSPDASSRGDKPAHDNAEQRPQRKFDKDIPDGFEPEEWQELPETEKVSLLQQVLSNPDAMPGDVDFSRSGRQSDQPGDADSAVSDYYRDSQVEVMCRKYPDQVATTQCPVCQAFFCQKAMTVRRGKLLCVDCAEAMFVRSEEEILDAAERGEDYGPDIAPEEPPEFELGNSAFGMEGRPAHPLRKLLALGIDWTITRFLVLCALFVMGGAGGNSSPLFALFNDDSGGTQLGRIIDAFIYLKPIPYWLILFAITDYLYYFLSLAFWNRSIGMSWVGIRVVTEWGEFASFGSLLIRTLIFIVLFEGPAVFLSWFFPAFRGLHDYAAGTVVVNYSGVKRVDAYETIQIKLN